MMNQKTALYIGGAAFLTGVLIMALVPRGVRNNNPLNIRKGNDWNGETLISQDKEFETFKNPTFGFRAGAKLIRNYYHNYGLTTVREILNRFAPPSENNTEAYIAKVSKALGVSDSTALDLEDVLPELLHAIAHHENGGNYYNLLMIKTGIQLA